MVLLVSGTLIVAQTFFPQTIAYSLSLSQLVPTVSVVIICLFTGHKKTLKQIRGNINSTIFVIGVTIALQQRKQRNKRFT